MKSKRIVIGVMLIAAVASLVLTNLAVSSGWRTKSGMCKLYHSYYRVGDAHLNKPGARARCEVTVKRAPWDLAGVYRTVRLHLRAVDNDGNVIIQDVDTGAVGVQVTRGSKPVHVTFYAKTDRSAPLGCDAEVVMKITE
jgi:hypothetical protein